MQLSVQSDDGRLVCLAIAGSITQREASALADPLREVLGIDGYHRKVCLDLSNATFLDSSGINWLIISQKRFHQHGGGFVLHSLPPLVMNVIKILRLQQVFTIADSPQAAQRLALESEDTQGTHV
jgi:anti-anti-sigma factor